ncbi:MAG: MFS transporter [Pseudobutyrivibrio sp.]|nr:MFS transporter [Pseudobutyrivibrio sp.]
MDNTLHMRLNISYGAVQGLYWAIYCCIVSYASAYLTGKGFSVPGIGLIMAVGYLIATVSQQVISSATDKAKRISVLGVMNICLVALIITELFLLFTKEQSIVVVVLFILSFILINIIQPLSNALNFYLQKTSVSMNYGACRSMGSLFFSVISLIVGQIMESWSINAAPVVAIVVSLIMLLDQIYIWFCIKDFNLKSRNSSDENMALEDKNDNPMQFIIKYRMFFIFLIGSCGAFFSHVVINNFFYQIVENVGGNTSDMGGIIALQAIVELPTMMFFTKINKRISTKMVISASMIFFVIKSFVTMLSNSVGMLYFSVLFQGVAFAAYIPAAVGFVDELMEEKDAVKGQGFLYSAIAIANFLACITSGTLIEKQGIFGTILVATVVAAVGAAVSIFGLVRIKTKYE